MIPKILHQIWLGDQSLRPQKLIDTWDKINPDIDHRFWTEENLPNDLKLKDKMNIVDDYATKSIILRWELLYKYGGIYFDTDTKALKKLDESFFDENLFTVYSNEKYDGNLTSCSVVGCAPGNKFIGEIVNNIYEMDDVLVRNICGWRIVGSMLLKNCIELYNPKIKIYPSHYFIPTFRNGEKYNGDGPVYCDQYWANSLQQHEKVKNYE